MPKQPLKRRTDGRFRVKYRNHQFYGATQAEARAKRDAYIRQEKAGMDMEAAGTTAAEYAEKWLSVYKSRVSEKVRKAHALNLRLFCGMMRGKTCYGDLPLRSITTSDIQAFAACLHGSGTANRLRLQTVKSMFHAAHADRIIPFDPAASIKPPKGPDGSHRALDPWEMKLIAETPHRMRLFALVMMYAGLRKGEAAALTTADIDSVIHVRRAVVYNGESPVISTPKSAAGVRTVPVVPPLQKALKGHSGPLLPWPKPPQYSRLRRAWAAYMRDLSAIHGAPVSIEMHDLRHTFATLIYDAGVDIKTAQAMLGHANPQITLRIYTHLSEARKKAAVQAMLKAAEKW